MLLYVFVIPGLIAKTLMKQRGRGTLYPSQANYDSRWTMRMGFVFAGYRLGYEWWEAVVMMRKCAFVLLSIFLRTYGASPQVVAASMVLIASMSAHLQHRPYQDDAHNFLESLGLHICLLQLLVTLMSNMIGRMDRNVTNSPLGLQSTILVILVVFVSTGYFFWKATTWTVHKSQDTAGAIGTAAKFCARFSCAEKRAPAVRVAPRKKFDIKLTMRALEHKRRATEVQNIQENSRMHKERLMVRIKQSRTHQDVRLQARLAARAKVKRARALEKCAPFSSLNAASIAKIVDTMAYREMKGEICREGAPALHLYVIVEGVCKVTIKGKHVADLNELTVFGESAIFEENARRNATVTGNVKVLVMSRSNWNGLLASGVLGNACVAALRVVREERAKMNMEV